MTRLNGIEIGQISLGDSDEAASLFDAQSPERMSVAGQHMFDRSSQRQPASWTT